MEKLCDEGKITEDELKYIAKNPRFDLDFLFFDGSGFGIIKDSEITNHILYMI